MAEDGTAAAEIIQRLGLNMYFYDPNVCPIYRQYCVDLIFAPCLALSCLCKTAQIMRAKMEETNKDHHDCKEISEKQMEKQQSLLKMY